MGVKVFWLAEGLVPTILLMFTLFQLKDYIANFRDKILSLKWRDYDSMPSCLSLFPPNLLDSLRNSIVCGTRTQMIIVPWCFK